MAISNDALGRRAYEAHVTHHGWSALPWRELPEDDRLSWRAVAAAVIDGLTASAIRAEAETREVEPTPDGWRQIEPTGMVVVTITGPTAEVGELLGRLGV